mmetsp:Transcript_36683/g.112999  ORF Transcript_36683/g.112999 Transcript_36683/m.112999 type:complete len:220 (-) Transcript_36683:169-828(-)
MASREECTVYVCGLPVDINETTLAQMFQGFGPVKSAKACPPKPGGSLAYGFIQYEGPESAKAAIEKLNGFEFGGATLQVRTARAKGAGKGGAGGGTSIYVCGLPVDVTDAALQELFQSFGQIASTRIRPSKIPNAPCYGFVDFTTCEAAQAAIEAMNGVERNGVALQVRLADSSRAAQQYDWSGGGWDGWGGGGGWGADSWGGGWDEWSGGGWGKGGRR